LNGKFPRLGAQSIAVQRAGNQSRHDANDDEHGSEDGGAAQFGAGTRGGG
jgi:hypothetical protein